MTHDVLLKVTASLALRSYKESTIAISRDADDPLDEEIHILIVRDGDRLFIAGRGTDSVEDAFTDAWAFPQSVPELDTHVHAGFLRDAELIFPKLEPILKANSDAELILTGHSAGAAIMIPIGAFSRLRLGIKPHVLHTYGCPRVAFSGMADYYTDVHVRQIKNGHDIVTRHPWPLWGFRHLRPLEHFRPSSGDHISDHWMGTYNQRASLA